VLCIYKNCNNYQVSELIIKDGYGGAMIWSLALDDFKGTACGEGTYPLISMIKEELETASRERPLNRSTDLTIGPTTEPVTGLVTSEPRSTTTTKKEDKGIYLTHTYMGHYQKMSTFK
jgi:hypothetical protein